jgi:glycosyltransferase involved in cell wall biosynthesis
MPKARKKILYLVTQSDNGGAQQYVYTLAAHFSATHDVIVASGEQSNGGDLAQRLSETNARYTYLPHLKRAINPWHDLLALRQIINLIKTERPDIIHLNSTKISILGSLAAKIIHHTSKIVYTVHGWVFNEQLSWRDAEYYTHLKPFAVAIERLFARNKDALICLSRIDKQAALRHAIVPAEKVHVIYNGRAGAHYLPRDQARAQLHVPSDAFVIGAISNMYPAKGLRYLLEAFALVVSQQPAMLVIIGAGPQRRALEKCANALHIQDRVRFAGAQPEAARLLPAFDVYTLPSTKEGLPFALIEAMQASLPIVATTVGAIPEVLTHEKNGLLIAPAQAGDLAAALLRLRDDESLRARLGVAAQQTAQEKFSVEEMMRKTKAVYEGSV